MTAAACCGIDPGREKFGLAVGSAAELLFSAIIPRDRMALAVSCMASGDMSGISRWGVEGSAMKTSRIHTAYLGGGTGHRSYMEPIARAEIVLVIVDERNTTLEGRKLYWALHPRTGLSRLIPVSLMTPPRPVDDLAAWTILKRGLGLR
jgi:RNase H-fold protein (predicted Holliday junction resolvase)